MKKTKNVERDTSGRRVVEPKARGTALFYRESNSGRPLNTYIVPIVKNACRFRRTSTVPVVLCLGTAISLYILHNLYANYMYIGCRFFFYLEVYTVDGRMSGEWLHAKGSVSEESGRGLIIFSIFLEVLRNIADPGERAV